MSSNERKEVDPDRIRYFHAKYISYSRAVGVMWAVLSICHLIITIVCLVQPSWLETSEEAPTAAYFGLWNYAIADPLKGKRLSFCCYGLHHNWHFSMVALTL